MTVQIRSGLDAASVTAIFGISPRQFRSRIRCAGISQPNPAYASQRPMRTSTEMASMAQVACLKSLGFCRAAGNLIYDAPRRLFYRFWLDMFLGALRGCSTVPACNLNPKSFRRPVGASAIQFVSAEHQKAIILNDGTSTADFAIQRFSVRLLKSGHPSRQIAMSIEANHCDATPLHSSQPSHIGMKNSTQETVLLG